MISKLKNTILNLKYKVRQNNYKKNSVKNLAIIYYVPKSNETKYKLWQDGFTEGIKLLESEFNITWINLYDHKPDVIELNKYDFILAKSCWNWIVDKYVRDLKGLKVPRGIVVSCSKKPKTKKEMFFYDVLWFQTYWYEEMIKDHPNTIHAYGVNSKDFFEQKVEKEIDVLGIGAVTAYKRFDKFINISGKNKVIVGDLNMSDSKIIIKELEKEGIKFIDYLPQNELALLINKSKLVYIPSEIDGGGERAVLEARLCNVTVKIEMDNPKLEELLKEPIWDEAHYSNQIKKGIENFLI